MSPLRYTRAPYGPYAENLRQVLHAIEGHLIAGGEVTNVHVHHNRSYNSCGFLEIASYFGHSKGTFSHSAFNNNLIIDSGWRGLLAGVWLRRRRYS